MLWFFRHKSLHYWSSALKQFSPWEVQIFTGRKLKAHQRCQTQVSTLVVCCHLEVKSYTALSRSTVSAYFVPTKAGTGTQLFRTNIIRFKKFGLNQNSNLVCLVKKSVFNRMNPLVCVDRKTLENSKPSTWLDSGSIADMRYIFKEMLNKITVLLSSWSFGLHLHSWIVSSSLWGR